jgi:hypothetical protein
VLLADVKGTIGNVPWHTAVFDKACMTCTPLLLQVAGYAQVACLHTVPLHARSAYQISVVL